MANVKTGEMDTEVSQKKRCSIKRGAHYGSLGNIDPNWFFQQRMPKQSCFESEASEGEE